MYSKFLLFLLLNLILAPSLHAREITDMAGRRVVVPDVIRRVFTSSPPATYMMYALDPTLLVGSNYSVKEQDKRFLRPEFTRLPVAGGMFGQGHTVNMETLLALKPDIVLSWSTWGSKADELFVERMRKAGIPTVFIKLDRLEDYPDAFRFMGDLFGRRERAKQLGTYASETLRTMAGIAARIPEKERLRVYYAEGTDGLSTEGEKSWHAQLIPMAGGKNVHKGGQSDQAGMEKVSMEQVLMYNPDVILTHDRIFYASLAKDRRWHDVRAVAGKRVYLIPTVPFNWFDRPPSFMRLLGLKWLAGTLYPKRYPLDIRTETRKFYRLFLGVELSERDIREILNR
ncbi:ABC transporter substrate-binding protein [Geobacter sp. FeAm09]|uniref:ABC transporter substrate-binding protein n=1 Tax=Geobacter sp. FeAm09 TaxID=2597769 RepID=UPI0011EF02D7|nr:ABC transporter substrate-binding protein [Geobacter sp. FeAm09]QEM68963.1 ABC transporter substrate-binding protein [Geobacter sp. FeAm09]